jgi:DNA-binding response OmpR family regulator
VIVIAANGTQTDQSIAMAAGADHFLAKPFSPGSIVKLVEALSKARGTSAH